MGQVISRFVQRRRLVISVVNAVGVWFYSKSTSRYFYLLRNDTKNPGCWGLPGGRCDADESLLEGLERECKEELGHYPTVEKIVPIEHFTSADEKFIYHTFFGVCEKEFIPTLNFEHCGYCWINSNEIPKPLHPGLWSMINIEEVQQKVKTLEKALTKPIEVGGPQGPEPTRYGDWERKGIAYDF